VYTLTYTHPKILASTQLEIPKSHKVESQCGYIG
jgi:hypothetical protein